MAGERKKKKYTEVPKDWDQMSAEEQDAFVDELIGQLIPRPEPEG